MNESIAFSFLLCTNNKYEKQSIIVFISYTSAYFLFQQEHRGFSMVDSRVRHWTKQQWDKGTGMNAVTSTLSRPAWQQQPAEEDEQLKSKRSSQQ